MGLLDNIIQSEYYQGDDLGNYQFVSLQDIINQFMMIYVGEDKIISKIKRTDVAFHAQRALQEFSFDTFKSCKAHEITVPATLQMPLPHDYVNYTKISSVDSSGIKHLLYPTSKTSNPFQILQDEDGSYSFPEEAEEVVNRDFSSGFDFWNKNKDVSNNSGIYNTSAIVGGKLVFSHRTRGGYGAVPPNFGHVMAVWQKLDVSDKQYINLSGDGQSVDITGAPGILRLGIMTNKPSSRTHNYLSSSVPSIAAQRTPNYNANIFNLTTSDGDPSYIEWNTSDNTTSKELLSIDVSQFDVVYVVALSFNEFYTGTAMTTLTATNNIDNISVTNALASTSLASPFTSGTNSSTWNSYKANTPSENQDDYQDDTYWKMNGNRYGLDPQHAQANGSFYIDCKTGKIHFSSNISGKTVILDYISDSLGTDEEMKVHKFAEEAMYRFMAHAVLSNRANIPEYQVMRFKKEKIAAARTAKLRLSNIKLEEITQILRGKSKQIKH